jgi:anti-anti-sigma factor
MLLDLSSVTCFSAAGVRVLQRVADTARERGVAMRLGLVSRRVDRVLDICEMNLPAAVDGYDRGLG